MAKSAIAEGKTYKRFVAYRVGRKSGKVLECKALRKEHMARNYVSFWSTDKRVRAFLALHTMVTDRYGHHKVMASSEIAW